MNKKRVALLGVSVDPLSLDEAVKEIVSWCLTGQKGYVVTPNLDHLVKLNSDLLFRKAYQSARLILADGMPLVWASRLFGTPLPERVAGSEMILPLCKLAESKGLSVFFLGTTREVLKKVKSRIKVGYPKLKILGSYAPPFGFEFNSREKKAMIDEINRVSPDIVFVALSPPKQEKWAHLSIDLLDTHAVLCIGAGLDFIAGKVWRAPKTIRKAGLEWLWRLLREPRRLWKRYLLCILWLPWFVIRQCIWLIIRKKDTLGFE